MLLKPFVFDIEVFPNYFLLDLYQDGKHWLYENPCDVAALLDRSANIVLAGFNNKAYDDIILQHIWQGGTDLDSIYNLSTNLITGNDWEGLGKIKFAKKPWAFSIDLFQLLEKKAGLKEWQCHTHYKTVKEANVSFTAPLHKDKVEHIRTYCKNDTESTADLLLRNWDKVELRLKLQEKFKVSNRIFAMGSARTAEEIFVCDYARKSNKTFADIKLECELSPNNTTDVWNGFDIILPCVDYETEEFNKFKEAFLTSKLVREDTAWSIVCPLDSTRHIRGKMERDVSVSWFSTLTLANRKFTMGVGGLHTQDERGEFYSSDEFQIIDADVTSYYPNLIVQWDLVPAHLPGMKETYAKILADRVVAKQAGDKVLSEALKLVANSSFGKYNERFSKMRSVKSALQITLNGQLMILMLVESLHLAGYEILSANTDGVTVKVPRGTDLTPIFAAWETKTRMKLEVAEYTKYIRRDINNYIAQTISGKIKFKGAWNEDSLKDQARIVKIAAEKYLINGIHPEETVHADNDIKHYVYYMHTKNGADLFIGTSFIGKTARWYLVNEISTIRRSKDHVTFANVPFGECACLCLDLPELLPTNLCKQKYIDEAWLLIQSIKPKQKKVPKKPRVKKTYTQELLFPDASGNTSTEIRL